jgi:RNA polymerase primary sigma factor
MADDVLRCGNGKMARRLRLLEASYERQEGEDVYDRNHRVGGLLDVSCEMDMDGAPDREVMFLVLDGALDVLSKRERDVIRLRFGVDGCDEFAYTRIARMLKTSEERVWKAEERALGKLRKSSALRKLMDSLS